MTRLVCKDVAGGGRVQAGAVVEIVFVVEGVVVEQICE